MKFVGKAITIICTDQQRSEHFYSDILGGQPIAEDGQIGGWYQLGSLVITLMPNASGPANSDVDGPAKLMLWLEVDDLAKAAKHFRKHQVEIVEEDELFLIVKDPDGLLIEVWQRDDARGSRGRIC